MELQVCWQQMGCLQLAMSGKEQRFIYLLSHFHLVGFGPLCRSDWPGLNRPQTCVSHYSQSHIQWVTNQEVTQLFFLNAPL